MSNSVYATDASRLRERGFQLLTPPVSIASLDPSGDGEDYDGLVVVSREEHQRGEPNDPDFAVEFVYRLLMAHRLPRDWEFPDKLAAVFQLDRNLQRWTSQKRQSAHFMCFETNGVGYGYASSFARKSTTKVIPYATVGRVTNVAPVNAKVAMPRLEALDNLRILMETGYFQLAKGAPGAKEFNNELQAFVWRGRNRPEAMQGQHDDLILAATGATWIGSKILPPLLKQVKMPGPGRKPNHGRVRVH